LEEAARGNRAARKSTGRGRLSRFFPLSGRQSKMAMASPLSVCVCSAAPCVRRDDVANNGVSFKPFVRH